MADDHPDGDVDLDFLRRSAREFLAERGGKGSICDLAEMDWIGLLVSEEFSGSGWRPLESCVIAEELGRAHDPTPWLGSVIAAAALASAPGELRDRLLTSLLKGSKVGGFARAGRTVRVIDGDKMDVLVTAGHDGLHLIDAIGGQPRWLDAQSLDVGRTSWCIDISAATGVPIGDLSKAAELQSVSQLLVTSDAIGALSKSIERLVAYLRDRVAFGAPIASFQAVQHRLVDLLVFEVKARAIVAKAARALAERNASVALAAAAHAFVAAKATRAIDECMQLSGGIGFTWEYPLHHDLRRASDDAWLFGTARSSRALLAEVSGW
jgi:alkylation response protein AidB-like acyl-CoA dehydrogenase